MAIKDVLMYVQVNEFSIRLEKTGEFDFIESREIVKLSENDFIYNELFISEKLFAWRKKLYCIQSLI